MGVVYILTNPAMPGLIKIGKTSRSIEDRLRELTSAPGVPIPFECFMAVEVQDADKLERALHDAFRDNRINPKREFFDLAPDRPAAILQLFQINDATSRNVTPLGDVVETQQEQEALNKERQRRAVFRFSQVGIPLGVELRSVFDTNVTCTVLNDRTVEFRGKPHSLSGAALVVAHETGRNWAAVQGAQYWEFEGKTLTELRDEAEDFSEMSQLMADAPIISM